MTILALKQALDLRKVKFRAKDPKADLAAKLLATEEERLKKATQGASKDHAAEDGSGGSLQLFHNQFRYSFSSQASASRFTFWQL